MTRDDIIRMAREAYGDWYPNAVPPELERFAALAAEWGAKQEREACAEMVDHILKEGGGTWGKAIRKRYER